MVSFRFQGKPFNITVIQVYPPFTNPEGAEVEWIHEDLQDLLDLTPKKDVLFIIGDWNAKVGSEEIPGVTGKCGLGGQNEAGPRLTSLMISHIVVNSTRSYRTFDFSFFSITGWGIDLYYCDIEWFVLETNRVHAVIFEIAPKYCISDSLVDHEVYSILLRDSCP